MTDDVRHLSPAPEPELEPILVTLPDGENIIVQPDDPAWPIAFGWREVTADLKRAERELVVKRRQLEDARTTVKDRRAGERRAHPQRDAIARIFDAWRQASGRTACKLTPERFDMTADRMGAGEDYDEAALTMAAVGVAKQPFVIDGEAKNDYETAMHSGGQVERYANRCPRHDRLRIRAEIAARNDEQLSMTVES